MNNNNNKWQQYQQVNAKHNHYAIVCSITFFDCVRALSGARRGLLKESQNEWKQKANQTIEILQ